MLTANSPGFKPDKNFMDVYESLGFSANYQYKLISLGVYVHKDVLQFLEEFDEKHGMNFELKKKLLLARVELRPHPGLQKELVKKFAGKTTEEIEPYIQDVCDKLNNQEDFRVGNWIQNIMKLITEVEELRCAFCNNVIGMAKPKIEEVIDPVCLRCYENQKTRLNLTDKDIARERLYKNLPGILRSD